MKVIVDNLEGFLEEDFRAVGVILKCLGGGKYDEEFKFEDIKIRKNFQSEIVYVENSKEQCMILLGDRLYMYYYSPYSKLEGTYEELADEYETMTDEERDWFNRLSQD